MSNANTNSLNGNKLAAAVKTGAGPAGTVAAATTTLVKATAVVPAAISATVTRNGGYVPHTVAAVGNFDRTVATSLGK